MAIGTRVWGTVSAGGGSNFTLTPGYPSSPAAGDLLVLFCYTRSNDSTSFTIPSGWESLLYTATANGTYRIMVKPAVGGESGTLSVASTTGANASVIARMCKVPGGETLLSSMLDGSIVEETEAAASPFSNAGVTTTQDGSLIFLFLGKTDGGDNTTNDFSSFSGGSLTWAAVANGTMEGFDAALGIGTAIKATAGSTGTLSASCTLAATGISVSFAIKEKATGTTYNDSITEAAAASDSLAHSLTANNAITEAASAADSLAHTRTTNDSITEAAAASDAVVGGLLFAESIAEAASATDSLAHSLTANQAITEAAAATDALSHSLTANEAITEAAAAADSLAHSLTMYEVITEAASAADALVDVLGGGSTTYDEALTEAANAADTLSTTHVMHATVAEAALATDSVIVSRIMSDVVVEAVGATGNLLKVWNGSAWV